MSPALQLNLSCGQTDLYPAARQAMSQALPNPIYYPPFHDVEGDCVTMLREILHTEGDVLLPVGSATYGEEAAFNTFLEHGEVCVTVNTGMFGQVLTDLVTVVGATAAEIKLPRGTAITLDQARQALRDHSHARMFAVVHLETTAGTLNPVREIGAMIRDEFPHRPVSGGRRVVPDVRTAAHRRMGHRRLLHQQPEVRERSAGDRHRDRGAARLACGRAAFEPDTRPVPGPDDLEEMASRAGTGAGAGTR